MSIKKCMAMILALCIMGAVPAGATTMEFTIGSGTLYVSDMSVLQSEIEAAPYIENGRTMVPVRVISEQFGAYVSWDGGKREVSITGDGNEIKFSIDADKAYVNGNLVSLDAPAVIKEGRTMVPLRFISEALGREVEYVDLTKQILITDEKPIIEINGDKIYADDIRFLKEFYLPNQGIEEKEYTRLLLEYIKELVIVNQLAEKVDVAIGEGEIKEILDTCSTYSSEIYKKTLVSSGVKMLSTETAAKKYINTYDFGVTDEEVDDIYKNEYICAKHILLLTMDPNTGEIYDTKTKNEANNKAAYALRKIKSGVSFDEVMKEFGEDPGVEYNVDGYVFTKGDMIEKFESAAYSLRTGEMTGVIESELGYHIIKRVELPEISEALYTEIFSILAQGKYEQLLDENISAADIKVNFTIEEIAEKIK